MPAGRRRPARTSPLEEDTMTKTLSVGWIGLGAMGAPMALVTARAGHRVTAFDMSREALEAVAPEVGSAGSARAAAEGADVVVIMVATGPQLDAVLFGEAGIAEVLSPQSTVLVMSTVGPRAMDEASARLLPVTSHVVDAPVSGGVARAGTGDLLVMVSGAQDDIAAARPLLDAMASNAPVVGLRPRRTASASRWSTSCCAACTSRRPARRWRSRSPWGSTSPSATRCSTPVPQPPSCSATAGSGWWTSSSTRPARPSTSSSRTWAW
jgi:hypothetical protein